MQERAAALGEMNVECGLPAQLSSRLRSFYARAGKCTLLGTTVAAQQRREGSVTIMGSASPGHPDGTGYEAAMLVTRDIVDVFWSLDLNLARRKHFPAISWSASTSNCVPALHAYFDQNDLDIRTLRTSIIDILKSADDLAGVIARVGKHMSRTQSCAHTYVTPDQAHLHTHLHLHIRLIAISIQHSVTALPF